MSAPKDPLSSAGDAPPDPTTDDAQAPPDPTTDDAQAPPDPTTDDASAPPDPTTTDDASAPPARPVARPKAAPRTTPRRHIRYAVVATAAFVAFGQSLLGAFVSDDQTLVAGGTRSFASALGGLFWDAGGANEGAGMYAHAYRPVVQLAFAVQQRLFGDATPGYHATSLLLHAFNSVLVLRWLERRLSPGKSPAGVWAALFGALLFAMHPAHAENVAWISGSTDLWMTAGWLLGFELLEREGTQALAGAGAALFAAVLAKEPAMLAPVLWLVDRWAQQRLGREDRRRVLASFGAVACAAALVYAMAWSATAGAGTNGEPTAPLSLARAAALLTSYASIALWPSHLTFQAQALVVGAAHIGVSRAHVLVGAALAGLLLVGAVASVRRPRLRPWVGDAAWFFLPLLPVVLLVQDVLSDRFLYLPLLGLVALAARGVERGLASPKAFVRLAVYWAAALVLVASVPASLRASSDFRSEESLWRSQLAAFPELPKPLDALGEELLLQRRFGEARAYFERGYTQAQRVQQTGAALHFAVHLIVLDQAASPEWDRPRIHQVAMGCVSLFERRRAEYQRGSVHIAMRLSRPAAVRLSGEALLVLVPCARALLADQDVDRALGWADRAATLRPRDPQILELAAIARARAGEFTGAGLALATLHQLSPQTDLSPLERRFEAARSLAAEPRPTDAKARALYDARLLLTLGTPEGARRALAPAIALAPTDHELVHTLAQTFVSEKRFDQAAAVLERGAALEPEDPFWALAVEALGRARAEAPELPRP